MYPSVIHDYRRPTSVQEAVTAIADGGAEASSSPAARA